MLDIGILIVTGGGSPEPYIELYDLDEWHRFQNVDFDPERRGEFNTLEINGKPARGFESIMKLIDYCKIHNLVIYKEAATWTND